MNRNEQYAELPRCITFLLEEDPTRATDDCVIAMAGLGSDEQVRIAREVRNGNVATFDELVSISPSKAAKPVVAESEVVTPEPPDAIESEEVKDEAAEVEDVQPAVTPPARIKRKYVRKKKGRKKKAKKSTSWVIQCRVRLLRDKVNQLAAEEGGCEDQLAKCHAALDDLIAAVKSMK